MRVRQGRSTNEVSGVVDAYELWPGVLIGASLGVLYAVLGLLFRRSATRASTNAGFFVRFFGGMAVRFFGVLLIFAVIALFAPIRVEGFAGAFLCTLLVTLVLENFEAIKRGKASHHRGKHVVP